MYSDARDWASPVFNLGKPDVGQLKITQFSKPKDYGDARDLLARDNPFVSSIVGNYRDTEFSKPFIKPLVVDLGSATINKVLKVPIADKNDVEWLKEYKKRKDNGESDSNLKAFPPFGRSQRKVLVDRSIATANDLKTKLDLMAKQLKAMAPPTEISQALISVLNNPENVMAPRDEKSANEVISELLKSGMPRDREAYGIMQRAYGHEAFYRLTQTTDGKGKIIAYLVIRAHNMADRTYTQPIIRADNDAPLQYQTLFTYMGRNARDGVFDFDTLIYYATEEEYLNEVGDISVLKPQPSDSDDEGFVQKPLSETARFRNFLEAKRRAGEVSVRADPPSAEEISTGQEAVDKWLAETSSEDPRTDLDDPYFNITEAEAVAIGKESKRIQEEKGREPTKEEIDAFISKLRSRELRPELKHSGAPLQTDIKQTSDFPSEAEQKTEQQQILSEQGMMILGDAPTPREMENLKMLRISVPESSWGQYWLTVMRGFENEPTRFVPNLAVKYPSMIQDLFDSSSIPESKYVRSVALRPTVEEEDYIKAGIGEDYEWSGEGEQYFIKLLRGLEPGIKPMGLRADEKKIKDDFVKTSAYIEPTRELFEYLISRNAIPEGESSRSDVVQFYVREMNQVPHGSIPTPRGVDQKTVNHIRNRIRANRTARLAIGRQRAETKDVFAEPEQPTQPELTEQEIRDYGGVIDRYGSAPALGIPDLTPVRSAPLPSANVAPASDIPFGESQELPVPKSMQSEPVDFTMRNQPLAPLGSGMMYGSGYGYNEISYPMRMF